VGLKPCHGINLTQLLTVSVITLFAHRQPGPHITDCYQTVRQNERGSHLILSTSCIDWTYRSNNNGAANTLAAVTRGLNGPAQLVACLEVALGCDPRGRRHHDLRHHALAVNARERRCRDHMAYVRSVNSAAHPGPTLNGDGADALCIAQGATRHLPD
jgi:hypothetical protein